jgi:VanZ family protein
MLDSTIDQRPTDHRKLVLLAFGGLLLAVAALLTPIPFRGRAAVATGDLVHAPLFGSLTLGILLVCHRIWPVRRVSAAMATRCLLVALSVFALGVLIEFAQSNFGRNGNLADAVNNGLGIFAATLCYWGWQLQRSRLSSRASPRAFYAAAGMLLALAWWSPVTMFADARRVQQEFPTLASFESRIQLSRFYYRECEATISNKDVTEGQHSMEVLYQATPYPAATLVEMESDWSQLKTLEVDVTLDASYPDADVQLMIKVIDRLHQTDHTDTYRGQWTITRGQTQHIRISREEILQGPDDRQLDLTKIKYLDLMLLDPVAETKVRFDNLRLTLQALE